MYIMIKHVYIYIYMYTYIYIYIFICMYIHTQGAFAGRGWGGGQGSEVGRHDLYQEFTRMARDWAGSDYLTLSFNSSSSQIARVT